MAGWMGSMFDITRYLRSEAKVTTVVGFQTRSFAYSIVAKADGLLRLFDEVHGTSGYCYR